MGLDMYLNRRTYVKNWDHMQPSERTQVLVRRGGQPLVGVKPDRISYIEEEVAYWRKANHIHQWFVQNCAHGEDDCKPVYVSREQLGQLLDLCKEVVKIAKVSHGKIKNGERMGKDGKWEPIMQDGDFIENAADVAELLPTAGGFFFGSTDYDEYYLEDTKHTIEVLEPLLAEPEVGDFYYEASW